MVLNSILKYMKWSSMRWTVSNDIFYAYKRLIKINGSFTLVTSVAKLLVTAPHNSTCLGLLGQHDKK